MGLGQLDSVRERFSISDFGYRVPGLAVVSYQSLLPGDRGEGSSNPEA